eukprot:scaffold3152_cov376-Prasinococcus_capsulatus_cf.AAC.3
MPAGTWNEERIWIGRREGAVGHGGVCINLGGEVDIEQLPDVRLLARDNLQRSEIPTYGPRHTNRRKHPSPGERHQQQAGLRISHQRPRKVEEVPKRLIQRIQMWTPGEEVAAKETMRTIMAGKMLEAAVGAGPGTVQGPVEATEREGIACMARMAVADKRLEMAGMVDAVTVTGA